VTAPSIRRVRLRIRGRVQGVNFRYYAQVAAREHRVHGWIRNRDDGDVESIVEGEPDAVARFVAWCRAGPAGARVEDVAEAELPGAPRYQDFRIVYSAPE
jgi:acylphosphatase